MYRSSSSSNINRGSSDRHLLRPQSIVRPLIIQELIVIFTKRMFTTEQKCNSDTMVSSSSTTTTTTTAAVVVVVPLALGVAAAAFRLLLWRARIISQSLEEDVRHIWSDGSMMLDCSNEELQESIIQRAIDRGNETLETCSSTYIMSSPTFYQSSSSSSDGGSSEEAVYHASNKNLNNKFSPMQSTLARPQQMTTQVGGIATHKHPMLIYDRFILKPLRLDVRSRLNYALSRTGTINAQDEATATCVPRSSFVDKKVDSTNVFRGIREVAFYESLAFASSMPKFSGVQQKGNDEPLYVDSAEISWAAMRLLSLHKNGSSTNEGTFMREPSYSSCIQFCRRSPTICRRHRYPVQLSHLKTTVLLAAYHAGDSVVVSRIQSHASAWHALLKEFNALKRLTEFTAQYFGAVDMRRLGGHTIHSSTTHSHLLLQNLIASFRQPNIIDIKMGTRTYEPTASISKQISQAAKYPQQLELGFRIVGMGIYMPDGTYQYWDKSFGVTLKSEEDVISALMTFFQRDTASTNEPHMRFILACVIQQLNRIKHWFEVENSSLVFYASSILIAYENSAQIDDVTVSPCCNEPIVKMIDFAHVCRRTGGDCGYLKGLRSLIKKLHVIQRRIT